MGEWNEFSDRSIDRVDRVGTRRRRARPLERRPLERTPSEEDARLPSRPEFENRRRKETSDEKKKRRNSESPWGNGWMTTARSPQPGLGTPRTRAVRPRLGRAETAGSSDTTRETARNARRVAERTGVTGVDRLDTGRASARCPTREAAEGSGAGRDPRIGARDAEVLDTTKEIVRARSPRTLASVARDAMDRAEFVDGSDTLRATVAKPDAAPREGTAPTDREDETMNDGKRNNPARRTCVTDAVKRVTGRRSVRNRITDRRANEAGPRRRISAVDAAKPGTLRATVRNRRITRAESVSKRGTLPGIVRTRKKRPRTKPRTWMPISTTT